MNPHIDWPQYKKWPVNSSGFILRINDKDEDDANADAKETTAALTALSSTFSHGLTLPSTLCHVNHSLQPKMTHHIFAPSLHLTLCQVWKKTAQMRKEHARFEVPAWSTRGLISGMHGWVLGGNLHKRHIFPSPTPFDCFPSVDHSLVIPLHSQPLILAIRYTFTD